MTEPKNAKAGLVPSVKTLLENAKASLLLENFTLSNNPWYRRNLCERVVAGHPYRQHHEVDFHGPYTVQGFRKWLDMIEAMEQDLGPAVIDNDSDGEGIYALWVFEIPYTEKEIADAQKWLDENPKSAEPATIKWRRPVPFQTGETKHDEDQDDDHCEYI